MSTVNDLLLLARLDSVEASTIADGDQRNGTVPGWCELVLDMEHNGATQRMFLTRHDAELVIEVLWMTLHPGENRASPLARLWERLDETMDYLMADDDPESEDQARARTLAEAIAMVGLPFSDPPDVDAVRAMAVERWEERQA